MTTDVQPPAQAPITNTDACASRLHDLCGALLFYYNAHRELPKTLDELKPPAGMDLSEADLVCPVSRQRYVYNPDGLLLPERNSRIVIYDPAPSHSNMRWAILIEEPSPGQPLITKVVAVPASLIKG